ncbi:MAG: DUF6377 domain-containing protein [Muribaculaceae bacterium]
MKRLILLICVAIGAFTASADNKFSDDELKRLDAELALAPTYDQMKTSRIDSLRQLAGKPGLKYAKRLRLWMEIADEYATFVSDSSLLYYSKAFDLARAKRDSLSLTEARLGRIRVLGVLGLFKEGVSELTDVESYGVPPSLRTDYLDAGRQLYSYMAAFAQSGIYYDQYCYMLNFYRNEQIRSLEKDSPLYNEFLAEHYYAQGLADRAKTLFNQIINTVPDTENVYARAAANMAIIKEAEGIDDEAAYYLALSSISDIKSSVKENTALQKLALYLYRQGDIAHAYQYLSASLADAVFCNARLRTNEVSRLMPLIDGAYKVQIEEKSRNLTIATIISSLLLVAMIIAIVMILKQMGRLHQARLHLKEANNIKDEYIGHFLELCSIYMDRLDNFCKVVVRKITAGQADELVKLTKSSKFAEDQHKLFYENFDSAFLHIYPTFIDEFNALLQPEERIEVKEPGKLTTELRIFAFLRMGVDDSAKVARFLHYSVNTIYAYRNKVKNKAIDRTNFEADVMKIGTIN